MKKNNYIFQILACFLTSLVIIFTTTNSLAQPANDCCTGAIPLTVDATNTCVNSLGTNAAATDCMEATPTCASYAGGDTWYEVTVPASGELTIDLDVGDGTVTDMGMSWYSGTCGALVELECDDDDGPGLFPSISQAGLNPGDVIYVQVWEFGNNAFGDFNICAYEPPPPPPGDECLDPIPYPGDVANGTCVTGFDFTIFSDSGNPSPTCDFGGDAVAWFSWTAPIVTAAGDPLDLLFDDGDGQANDCDIGIEVYETDCTTPASGCLGNVSGTLSGLTQGTDYVLLIYDDSVPDASCDFCLSIACSSPAIAATVTCQPGDEGNFYVEVDVTNFGVGNTAYTVDVGGPQANITAAGIVTYGPFPSGTPVDVVLTGVDDDTCGATITGLDKDCTCDPLSVEAVADGTICPGDPFTLDATLNDVIPGGFVDYTVTPGAAGSCTAVPDNPADCVDLALGDDAGSGPLPLGFNFDFFGITYSSVCVGSNGYVTFTCVDETDLSEDPIPTPGDPDGIIALFWDDLNPTDAASGIICTYPATIGGQTCFVVDYMGIAHFGGGETVTGQIIICPDNTITINCIDCQGDGGTDSAGQGIEDETGSTGYFDPAFPGGTVPGAATTSNCVTFTPNVDPDSACDFVAWVTDINDIPGTTVSTSTPANVNPTMTTTYYAVVDCDGVPCFDDVVVTMDDPANCTVCQGIDLAAGLPVVPTEVCSAATADICLTLIDAAEGLVVTGTIDGAPVTLTGVAGAGPNELCVTIDAPINETCAPVDVVIEIETIQCTDGTDYPGILGGATLVDDLTGAGLNPLNVPVYPTLTVNTAGDGTCGMLTAELVAADGTVCATAAGSPFTCTVDGETLDYDFTADVAAFTAVPADCPLPTLSGTLTCAMCTEPCTATVAVSANPADACTTDGTVNICVDVTGGDAAEVTVDVDGTTATGAAGDAQICVALALSANQTCAAIMQDYMISSTCANGDELIAPTAGSINVHPEGYMVAVAGDGMCGMLTAELQAIDGTTCGTAVDFTCAADGETLAYDFTADADAMACTLPTLSGTLTCGSCGGGATCSLTSGTCNPCGACETIVDLSMQTPINDAGTFGGGPAPTFPDYDNTTNMGTLTILAGSADAYAVSGVTDIVLSDVPTDLCLTLDINVVSGTTPFVIEFRIENGTGAPGNGGEALVFDATVDGSGMCSIGGGFANGTLVNDNGNGVFDYNLGATTIAVALASFGAGPLPENLIVEISNLQFSYCTDCPSTCQGIDIAAGLPVVPTEVCSGATADICLTLFDVAEGLVVSGTIDGAPVTLTGVAGANPNELCVSITAPANETCDIVDVVIEIQSITCADGTDYPGILGGATLLDDLTDAGLNPLNVPVYPTLTVNTSGDGACGDLTAELVAADGTVCATAAGSPFTCSADAETLDYDFTGDVTFAPPATLDCQLPILTGTLTCSGCGCASTLSAISTADPTRICIDGVADPIDVTIDTDGGGVGTWVITDAAGIILALPAGPPFDLDGAGAGQCLIWYANADDATFAPMVGDDAAAAVEAFGCAFLSNPITVDRIEVTAATISSPQSPITICTDDDIDEPVDVTIDDAGIGAMGAWVITDAAGTILALPAGPPFVLDGAGVGICYIWWVNYDDPAFAPMVGDDAPALVVAATCAALSNSVEVIRQTCEPCEDPIMGTVTTDETTCDLAGTMVEILDDMGNPVAGSPVTIAADGSYSLPGPFPCGTYTAQIVTGSAPQCYYDLSGSEGPFQFEVDGDGEADGVNFSTEPQVPTLSQWGLITLALLMMCFGAIKLTYSRRREFSF